MRVSKWIILTCLINFLLVVIANAQEAPAGGTSAEELAKKLSNPVTASSGLKPDFGFKSVFTLVLPEKIDY